MNMNESTQFLNEQHPEGQNHVLFILRMNVIVNEAARTRAVIGSIWSAERLGKLTELYQKE